MPTERKYDIYQVDSFTRQKFSGNPAGVVPHAEGLTEKEMQLIARELKNSETAFVFEYPDHTGGYDVEVRFFTPSTEVPICGHATIAAHYVRAVEQGLKAGQVVRQKTKAGILPVEIVETGGLLKIKMTQGTISFNPVDTLSRKKIIHALGLQEEDIMTNCPLEIVSTGHSKVLIGIRSAKELNRLMPDLKGLATISAAIGCNGFFVFTLDSDKPDVLTHGRMFAPAIGIDEDPVTGNANGPLGAYIVKHKLANLSGNRFVFTASQGEAIGRAGTMDVVVEIEGGEPVKIEIAGSAVTVFKTTIEL